VQFLYPADLNAENFVIQTPGQYHRYDCCNGKQHVLISVTSHILINCIYCYEQTVFNWY